MAQSQIKLTPIFKLLKQPSRKLEQSYFQDKISQQFLILWFIIFILISSAFLLFIKFLSRYKIFQKNLISIKKENQMKNQVLVQKVLKESVPFRDRSLIINSKSKNFKHQITFNNNEKTQIDERIQNNQDKIKIYQQENFFFTNKFIESQSNILDQLNINKLKSLSLKPDPKKELQTSSAEKDINVQNIVESASQTNFLDQFKYINYRQSEGFEIRQ